MKTLVILHGWQSSKESWDKVKNILQEKNVKVIVPDLPGFKPKTKLEKPWDLDTYVDWAKEYIKKELSSQDLKKGFFLLGHSFGGRISIKIASRNPDYLKGLILVSAAGIKKSSFLKKTLGLAALILRKIGITKFKFWDVLRKFFYYYILRRKDYYEAEGHLEETIKNVLNEDLTHLLKDIKIDTKIIWGKKDRITPLRDGRKIHKGIKNSSLKILKDGSHIPYKRHPKKLSEEIYKFVSK